MPLHSDPRFSEQSHNEETGQLMNCLYLPLAYSVGVCGQSYLQKLKG